MSIKPKVLVIFGAIFLATFGVAYLQWALFGLPAIAPLPEFRPGIDPSGFPGWLRITHFVNFLFMVLLIRSGLQILADHPRLYTSIHCTPGTEWIRFTRTKVPTDRLYTAKDDSVYLTPLIGLPGRRHTIGMARHWHFLSVLFWVSCGVIFVALLFVTDQWKRLVPMSWDIIPQSWNVFVHYATFHMPPEPDGFYHFNALQQLSYFGVTFILAPLAIISGPSMSPAFTARFKKYPNIPGNRQIGRTLHFFVMCAFVGFIVIHVTMVVITGFARNMNHITLGTDTNSPAGLYIGSVGLLVVIGACFLAHWAAWNHPRRVQHAAKAVVNPIMRKLLGGHEPVSEFPESEISPFYWPNGKLPTSDEWLELAKNGFVEYRLKVFGHVENPVELSLADLREMEYKSQVTLHHCIQGWSGVAQWGGLPVSELIKLVKPKKEAVAVAFLSFGEGGEGGQFYDSLPLENAMHEQTLLAYEMNHKPLGEIHGAPLRLRVENLLGFKMVKWIQSIEFVSTLHEIYQGEGGYNEDHEYFGERALM